MFFEDRAHGVTKFKGGMGIPTELRRAPSATILNDNQSVRKPRLLTVPAAFSKNELFV